VTTDLRVEDVAVDTEDRSSSTQKARLTFRLFLASIVAAFVPIAVAAARAINDGWIPTGDNALFAVRSRDLFTQHLPLFGTWSSASLTAGTNLNHPGPLYFDLLALPAKLVDSGAGIVVGVAVINALCVAGIAVFAYRRGGALVGTVATAVAAALCWTMSSQVLFEPWNPHSTMLPFLFFLVLVWSLADGDLLALPFAAVVASLVVQTHLSYVLLVPLLGAWGIVGFVLRLRRERRDADSWPARRRDVRRLAAVAVGLFAVCWIQPLIEQFTGDGQGNLTRLADSVRGSDVDTIGFGFGTRVVATIIALPPWWFRSSMNEAFIPGWDAPSAGAAALGLVVLAGVLLWCAWDARHRGDQAAFWAVGTAAAALLAAIVTAGQGPVTVFGRVTAHTFRWLWPLGAFVFLAVAASLVRRFGRGTRAGESTPVVAGFACVTVVVAALAVPYADQGLGPNSERYAYALPGIRDLERHMGPLEDEGPLLIDDLFQGPFADPYGAAVIAELQRRGISFVARERAIARQFGDGRRYNGDNAKAALLLRQGEATLEAPPGARLVARGQGMSRADVRELDRLKAQIGDYIGERNLQLNARGQAALQAGKLPTLAAQSEQAIDVSALFATRELDVMIRERYLVLDDTWTRRFIRYADLQHEWDQKTVALFVAPVSSGTRART
jgi:hypothetical protein